MSVVYQEPNSGGLHLFAKGAVERIIDQCSHFGYGDKTREITPEDKQKVLEEMEQLAKQGLVRSTLGLYDVCVLMSTPNIARPVYRSPHTLWHYREVADEGALRG